MKRLLLFLFLVAVLISCREKQNDPVKPNPEPPADTTQQEGMRYLALGDSYTIGQSVPESERWPVQLSNSLDGHGFDVDEVEIVARTGWTTSELANGIEEAGPQGPYDMVSLLIGVNNQYRRLDTAEYRVEFRELLEQSIFFAGNVRSKVFVVSIPDYSVTPFAQSLDTARIAREIDEFNAINLSESIRAGVDYINVTPISRLARYDTSLIATDGLHPSGKMYTQWVKEILPVAQRILEDAAK